MTTNPACPHTKHLASLVDGVLPEDLQAQLERHLDECEICLRSLKDYVSDDAALSFLAKEYGPLPRHQVSIMPLRHWLPQVWRRSCWD